MQTAGKTLAMVACSLSLVSGIARGNLITNPSFETPVVTAGSFENFATGSTGITGWTVTGPTDTGVSAISTTFVQNGVTFEAEDGNQWIDLTGDGSNSTEGIEQTVTTAPGTNYVLTFYVGNTTGGGIFGTTSTDALSIDGTEVNTYENANADATGLSWEQFTYSFTATGASTTIGFANLDPASDNSNGLDMVDLEVGSSTATPEPGTEALVGGALVLLAFALRRRSRVNR
jgi:hypothetical protein